MGKYVPFGPGKRYWWEGNRAAKTGRRHASKAHTKVHVKGPTWEHVTQHNAPKGPLGH